jgi:CheY-like chemotaxis protein
VTEGADRFTVLVYSDDPQTRDRIRLSVGRRPAPDIGWIEYVDAATGDEVIAELDAGGLDLAILDGEAAPYGGMGLCRQAKDEIRDCPAILVVVARRDDAWLASWSRADCVLSHPIDAVAAAGKVAEMLRAKVAGVPVRR